MTELNGFKIEKFNQHGLQENVKRSTCPLCSENRKPANRKQKCLMVDWNRGMAHCCHCGENLQLHTYKKKENESSKIYKKPEWNNKTTLSDSVVKWFEGRKISQRTLSKLQITTSTDWMPKNQKNVGTIHFNYFRDEELINIKYRARFKNKQGEEEKDFRMVTDAEKIPYNLDNIRADTECIIVEGEIDVLSVVESGFINCVSSPNGSTTGNVNLEWLDNSIDYFDNKEKIILALDDDEPGQNVQNEIIRRLGAERCFLVDLKPHKDFNEVLTKESIFEVQKRIENAKQCPLENVITYNDLKSELHDFYINGAKKGFQIGLPSFDNMFSTYTKQYIVVTGIPRHGKSDFVDQMTVGYNMNYGWKVAYCSPENKPNFLHSDKIIRKIAGYRAEGKEDLAKDKWIETEKYMNDNFFHVDFNQGYDLDSVLAKFAELVKRKGVKCFVIDPYNKVRLKGSNRSDINQYTEDYLNKIDQFCQKYDCLIILVAHPKKMNKINGITPEPDFYDVKGGGEFFDMSYHGLLVHRDFDRKTVKVKVLKVKFANLGENEAESHFMWNVNNGRYTELEHQPESPEDAIIPIWDNSHYLFKKDAEQQTIPQENWYDNVNAFEDEFQPNTEECPF